MKLNVPFYKQTTPLNCGPAVLKCVLSYFGKNFDLSLIEEKAKIKPGKGVSTIQLAIASASLGFKTELYSKCINFNEENMKLDYYKKYNSVDFELTKKLIKKANLEGVKIKEKTFSLNELLDFVTQKSAPIVLLDWNIILNENSGYQGHFVPIVGYDEENVYIHNVGLVNAEKFLKIPKRTFELARKAKGTDEDILVLYQE